MKFGTYITPHEGISRHDSLIPPISNTREDKGMAISLQSPTPSLQSALGLAVLKVPLIKFPNPSRKEKLNLIPSTIQHMWTSTEITL
jgi:hypothetical protein